MLLCQDLYLVPCVSCCISQTGLKSWQDKVVAESSQVQYKAAENYTLKQHALTE